MKYYSIHFDSVAQLRYTMSRVFEHLKKTGIHVYFFRKSEYCYNFEVGDELTFICVIRTGNGYLQGIRVLGAYSATREPNEDPEQIFDWIMDKYQCNTTLNPSTRAKDYFEYSSYPQIKKVIFNDPATIVFWSDGSNTVVKAQNGEVYDPEKGLAMAITKKRFGNKGNYYNNIKKWLPKDI